MKNRKIILFLLPVVLFPLICFAADKKATAFDDFDDSDYVEVGSVEKKNYSDMDIDSLLAELSCLHDTGLCSNKYTYLLLLLASV